MSGRVRGVAMTSGVVMLLLTSCSSTSPQQSISQAVTRWSTALADGDSATFCGAMTADANADFQGSLDLTDCPAAVAKLSGVITPEDKEGLRSIQVNADSVQVHDSQAVVSGDAISYAKPVDAQLQIVGDLAMSLQNKTWLLDIRVHRGS